jgi:hypothetical protein
MSAVQGDETAKTIEWDVEAIHVIGTLRGNRGSEKKYQWSEKMGKAAVDALRAKPLVPDRVKVRVTADNAQVMTVAIFDKKGFQMIDTYHTEVVETTKQRLVFDKAASKPTHKAIAITESQNEYNLGMGFVDLDDLLAWFYRHAHVARRRLLCSHTLTRARALARSRARALARSRAHMHARSLARSLAHLVGRIRSARASSGGPFTFGSSASAPTERIRRTSSASISRWRGLTTC